MKLIHKDIEKDGKGTVVLIPEEAEDMWQAYNIIRQGDHVRASTIRKVQNESATGSSTSQRVRTTLTVSVEAVDFDTQACLLRLKGRNIEENDFVKMGAYHTLDLELNRKFSLLKEEWDSIDLERIEMAIDPTQTADVAAVIMQEGLAHVCLISGSRTIVRAKIDQNIPRKRKGDVKQHEKGILKFFELVLQATVRHIKFDVVKCIIIASPGFVRDQFYEYMLQEAVKMDNKIILENKSKFITAHSSSGFKHSLKEVLSNPSISSKLEDTKALGELKVLENFYKMLQTESTRAFYGINHVEKANEAMAIETLLIIDSLFRSQNIEERKRYVKLVDSVRESGGDAKIFSSLHVTGEQLTQITGVAAILRFPMPELEDFEDDDDSNDNTVLQTC
ncbi:protein pelota [Daktulosphaira vitifoliae]|uniref:protein pelota n=1 Tax=Daktulosphaira vitifoliae TaxID=58002 RepID=UPI0021A9C48C|nr:protein pelota [Daktulosphaira vitifoliae]